MSFLLQILGVSFVSNSSPFFKYLNFCGPIVLAQETNEAVVGVAETKIEEEAPKAEAAPAEGQAAAAAPDETGAEIKAAPEKK